MDADFNATRLEMVVYELRLLVVNWLDRLLMGHLLYGAESALPQGFPFGGFVMEETFEWTARGANRPYAFRVTFEHGGRSHTSSVFWRIKSGNVTLGVFEIPPQICDAGPLPFDVSGSLVLEAMLRSVEEHKTVGLVARIGHHP
ncbi:hypothetical protein DFH07DRAFT_1068579, partial [Mycena maculata]